MAHQSGSFRVKSMVMLLALALGIYIVGPPLYWQLHEAATLSSSYTEDCPVCRCDCSTSDLVNTAFANLGNLSQLIDFGRDDPDEVRKSREEQLEEEVRLQETVAEDNRQRAEMALLDSKKVSSQYQKEAEKCNIGMETSEEAREKAEAALGEMKKTAAMWEERARKLGWKEDDMQVRRRRALGLQ